MNKQEPISRPVEAIDPPEVDTATSVDDFIRELEAKEKDLHITADLQIEIEDPDVGMEPIPEFVLEETRPRTDVHARAARGDNHSAGHKTRVFELEQEIEKLNERIIGLRADRNEIQEKSDRRLKDFEAYKYRMDRERRGAQIENIATLASQMLPVLDNLDRALESAEGTSGEKSAEFQQFFDGIELVNRQVRSIFGGLGVEPITTVGERFDPNFHEAVAIETSDEHPPNTVTAEVLRGYRIGNRVIRHSMVHVTAVQPAQSDAAEPESPETTEEDTADEIEA